MDGDYKMKRLIMIIIGLSFLVWFITGCSNIDKEKENNNTVVDGKEISFVNELEYDISSINNKECVYQPFCYDDNNIYFSNIRDNQYIYKYDGTSTELIVEMPAFSLNYYNDSIYFISNNKTVDIEDRVNHSGIAYRLDLNDMSLNAISDETVMSLAVNNNGIFYLKEDEDSVLSVYKMNEYGTSSSKLYHSFSIQTYGEYHIEFRPSDEVIDFYLTDGKNDYKIVSGDIIRNDSIADNKYFFRLQNSKGLYYIDLGNGTQTSIVADDHTPRVSDYTVINEEIIVLLEDGYIYKWDGDELIKLESDRQYKYLYTNNKDIYVISELFNQQLGKNEYFFSVIEIEDDDVITVDIS